MKGHTQTDGDCMHSVIEAASNNKSMYTQDQWVDLIRSAKTSPPFYEVCELTQPEILDFAENVSKQQWKRIPISKISSIMMCDGKITYIKSYKEALIEEKVIWENKKINQCYMKKIPLSEAKKKDFANLINGKLFPNEFHNF